MSGNVSTFSVGDGHLVIFEYNEVPSMCPEFEVGPPEDADVVDRVFWQTSLSIYEVHTDTVPPTIAEVKSSVYMKTLYGKLRRRAERIEFWHGVKYMERFGNDALRWSVFDAADASFYKPIIKQFAKDKEVRVERIGEDQFKLSWRGPSYNAIINALEEEEETK
jgi:hypothetical protein